MYVISVKSHIISLFQHFMILLLQKTGKMEFYTAKHGKGLQFINGNIVKHNGTQAWQTCIFGKEINNKMCKQFSISVKVRKGYNTNFMFGYITSTIEEVFGNQSLGSSLWNKSLGSSANCRTYEVHYYYDCFHEWPGDKPLTNYKAPDRFQAGDTFKCVFNFGNNEFIIYHNGTKAQTLPILNNAKTVRFAICPAKKDSEIEIINYELL